jgi:hypothetical protein
MRSRVLRSRCVLLTPRISPLLPPSLPLPVASPPVSPPRPHTERRRRAGGQAV